MFKFVESLGSFVFLTHCILAQNPLVGPEISTTTTSELPTLDEAKYYAHFTGAVYCDVNLASWTCFECLATGPNVKLVTIINNAVSDTRAIVNINNVTQEIIITFRGTLNAENLASNSDTTLFQPFPESPIKVHRGNWNSLLTLYPEVSSALRAQLAVHSGYSVVIAGHSLGGVLSTLLFLKLRHDPEFLALPYSVYTYGMRRAGNQDFATWFNAQSLKSIRVVNRGDIIPEQTLQSQGYLHVNTELWIHGVLETNTNCRRDVFEDNSCSNSVQLYNFVDHLFYWNVDYTRCPIENYLGISPTVFATLYDGLRGIIPGK